MKPHIISRRPNPIPFDELRTKMKAPEPAKIPRAIFDKQQEFAAFLHGLLGILKKVAGRKAGDTLLFICSNLITLYGVATNQLGRPPTVEEFTTLLGDGAEPQNCTYVATHADRPAISERRDDKTMDKIFACDECDMVLAPNPTP